MSKQLKPFLKEIADSIRDCTYVKNIFSFENFKITNTTNIRGYGLTDTGFYVQVNDNRSSAYGIVQLGKLRDFKDKTITVKYDFETSDELAYDGSALGLTVNQSTSNFVEKHKVKNGYFTFSYEDGWDDEFLLFRFWISQASNIPRVEFNNFTVVEGPSSIEKMLKTESDAPKISATDFSSLIKEAYNQGKKDMLADIMNRKTDFGTRDISTRQFNREDWTGITFPDGYVKPTSNSPQMFYSYEGTSLPHGIDLSQVPAGTNSSNGTSYALFSHGTYLTHIPDVGLPVQFAYSSTFAYCPYLTKIDKIRVNENTTFSSTFTSCSRLKEVTFEGTIGKSISFSASPLEVETMKHIIEHLKNFSETDQANAGTQTITFSTACWEALEASGEAPGGGTWENYIVNIGWLK